MQTYSAGVDNGLVVISLRSLVLGVIRQVHADVELCVMHYVSVSFSSSGQKSKHTGEGYFKAKGSKASNVLGDSSRELADNQVSLDTEAMVWNPLLQELFGKVVVRIALGAQTLDLETERVSRGP